MALRNEQASLVENLPWKGKSNGKAMHSLCSRICSFPPALVRYFIDNYSKEGDVVFDPFSGKGTLGLEALYANRIGIGNDISPEAHLLTNAKLNIPDKENLLAYVDTLRPKLGFLKTTAGTDLNVKIFYSEKTLKQILELKILLSEKTDANSIFVKAIILGILHGSSKNSLSLRCSHSYSMSPNYVKQYAKKHKLRRPTRDVVSCIKNRIDQLYSDGIPNRTGEAHNCDSRNLDLSSESVDLIITSPPYFAVQTYAADNWLRLWFLGYDYKEVNKKLVNTSSEEKYGLFMQNSLKEMHRVLKAGSYCFIVVGDVKKRTSKGDIIINTAEFLIKHAEIAGFKYERMIVDKIPQTKKVLNSALCTTGISTERILCLKKFS